MIATNLIYAPSTGHIPLRQQILMDSTPDVLTISTLSVFRTEIVIVTTTDILASSYTPNMKIVVAGTGSALNGIYTIHSISYSTNTIVCRLPQPIHGLNVATISAGTVTIAGVADLMPYKDGTIVRNNAGEVMAHQYAAAGTYLIDTTHLHDEVLTVQINNHGAKSITIGVQYSIDGILWVANVSIGTVAAGQCVILSTEDKTLSDTTDSSVIKRNMMMLLNVGKVTGTDDILYSVSMR